MCWMCWRGAAVRDWEDKGEGRITDAQRKMINAICGDLSAQVHWHGHRLHKDDWRHLFSGIAAGWRVMQGWDYGDGRPAGIIMLGASSLRLTRAQACDAITMAVHFGDDPESQGVRSRPVIWSDTVLLGLGFNPADFK